MSRTLNFETLSPEEMRIAHLHIAQASTDVIAYLTECSQAHACSVLKRPHVASYILKLVALNAQDMIPAMHNVTEAIETATSRAFEVELKAMERLFGLDNPEDKRFVHAQVSSAQIAQDILDRAGKRAPTKIAQTVKYEVDNKTLDALSRIVKDHDAIDITPTSAADGD